MSRKAKLFDFYFRCTVLTWDVGYLLWWMCLWAFTHTESTIYTLLFLKGSMLSISLTAVHEISFDNTSPPPGCTLFTPIYGRQTQQYELQAGARKQSDYTDFLPSFQLSSQNNCLEVLKGNKHWDVWPLTWQREGNWSSVFLFFFNTIRNRGSWTCFWPSSSLPPHPVFSLPRNRK